MKHHYYNHDFPFVEPPVEFNIETHRDFLKYCLGGVLYMPGTKNIISKIMSKEPPALSMVMCFEDAIRLEDLQYAETNVLKHLKSISLGLESGDLTLDELPLIFVRVRSLDQFISFCSNLDANLAYVLTGFVFPKFDSENGSKYLRYLEAASTRLNSSFYGMPILEGSRIAYKETRDDELGKIKAILDGHRDRILNIRVGANDFSSLFGVRRGINYSIYDIMAVRDCLSDILNYFGRADLDYVISAPVWEYFLADNKESIENLIGSQINRSILQRNSMVNEAIDGLLREVILDKANGFVGKTIIHPSHLPFVNGMQAITREEYDDAQQVLDTSGGVIKSESGNKMNEINPHRSWANKIVQRAAAYGVIEDEAQYLRLILGSKVGSRTQID